MKEVYTASRPVYDAYVFNLTLQIRIQRGHICPVGRERLSYTVINSIYARYFTKQPKQVQIKGTYNTRSKNKYLVLLSLARRYAPS